jgi:preprotein translocase subunit SecE
MSAPGKQFFAFAQESWQEAHRVAWPTRKETVQTTAIVFAFVVIMALFLFAVDSTLAWLVQLITGRVE